VVTGISQPTGGVTRRINRAASMSLIRNSGRHQHHCRSRTRWPEFLIRLNGVRSW